MSSAPVTVALPVLDGARHLDEVLTALGAQRVDRPVEVLVADSGSSDGSQDIARRHGATVIEVPAGEFSHGGTRNLLMERAGGAHVAFLTQDATPAHERWLERLLGGFDLAPDVALAFGPYRPRPEASEAVRRELHEFFEAMSPDGEPVVTRAPLPRDSGGAIRPAPATFFSDANGCVARRAWEEVPFREVPYAEDRLLAVEMLDAGYAKAFVPGAEVVHSHDYGPVEHFRRCFDEWRGLREVLGHVEPAGPRRTVAAVRRAVAADGARSLRHHLLRAAGAVLGSRADRLPARVRRACSLERRATFEPVAPRGRARVKA